MEREVLLDCESREGGGREGGREGGEESEKKETESWVIYANLNLGIVYKFQIASVSSLALCSSCSPLSTSPWTASTVPSTLLFSDSAIATSSCKSSNKNIVSRYCELHDKVCTV